MLGVLSEFSNPKTLSDTASIAHAVGRIRDPSAIDPLLQKVEDKHAHALVRAFACVALGLLAERSAMPWNAEMSIGLNYRARTAAIAEILDTL